MFEPPIIYSSLTLVAMGCLTLVLSLSFRLKYRRMNSLPKSLSANLFSKTFNVFDPYPEHRKVIHSFLSMLPMVVFVVSMVLFVFLYRILEYGFLLSLLILIVGLNLILVEEASEFYHMAEVFIKAINNGAKLGIGDVKAFQILKKAVPRLGNYYLALSILFFVSAAMLSYIWSSVLWFIGTVIGLMVEVSAATGFMAFLVATALFTLSVAVIQILVSMVKNKFLSSSMELPSIGD